MEAQEKSTRELFFPDLYLSSGGQRIDYVLVFSYKQVLSSENSRDSLAYFLENLIDRGFHLEQTQHSENPDICFIKIHIPQDILVNYADLANINLMFKTSPLSIEMQPSCLPCRRTALSYNDERSPIFHRAKATIGREHPTKMLQSERILIAYNMLQEIRFGPDRYDVSLIRLQRKHILKDSFALHEGPTYLTPRGPLLDRQLLADNWGDMRNFFKEQPTDIVQKYFGPELAFYFDFVQFLDQMLLFCSIFSIILFIVGCVVDWNLLTQVRDSVCNSEEYLCATCNPAKCKLTPMKKYCQEFKDSHMYDNTGTFILGICMSFFGTVFVELWKRRKNYNLIKWNLLHVELDISTRIGYEEQTDVLELSPITQEWEPTMSKSSLTWRYFLIVFIMLALMMIVFFTVLLTIYMKKFLGVIISKYFAFSFVLKHKHFIVSCVGSFIQVLFIMVVDKIKSPSVIFMTHLENCRTQIDHDNSFVMKLWIIDFVNCYTAIFYIAFIKGIFYTNPGDESVYKFFTFKGDLCGAAGCNVDLIIMLTFMLAVKTLLVKSVKKVFIPILKSLFFKKREPPRKFQWEGDYPLPAVKDSTILMEYAEIVNRLTMVLFFTAVFPFVPLITFCCNYVEERVDANTYVNFRRRPIPRKVTGLGVWAYIIYFIVALSVFINALTSLLTKRFLNIFYYSHTHDSLDGYLHTEFSKFAIQDYTTEKIKEQVDNLTYCLYMRPYFYPYDHPNKYEKNPEHFPLLAFGACFLVVYQHVVIIISMLIAKLIPDVSSDVEEHLSRQMLEERKMLKKHHDKKFLERKVSFNLD